MPKRRAPHISRKTVDPKPFGPGLNAHRLVAETAIAIAQELFELYAKENELYRKLRANGDLTEAQARLVFVGRVAPKLLEDAREQLTSVLAHQDTTEYVRETIAEALIADNDLRANRLVAERHARIPKHLH